MARLQIELADDLRDWAAQAASRNGLSLDAYLEMLIALESGSGRTARDGRKLRMRSFIYRDGEHYFVPQGASGT
jgi:hypothetical protein